jgi:hypothetical protein
LKNFKPSILAYFLILPLSPQSLWKPITFEGVPKNEVHYSKDKVKIKVQNSASPLIYPFDEPKKVAGLSVEAELLGTLPRLPQGKAQGLKETDDYVLRIGLILKGDSKLNWMQRQIAPSWLVEMERLVPEPYGIKHVEFFTTCLNSNRKGKRQAHYMNEKLQETCVTPLTNSGKFKIEKDFSESFEVLGLWVAADADQLKNQFEVVIHKIELK